MFPFLTGMSMNSRVQNENLNNLVIFSTLQNWVKNLQA